MNGAAVTVHGGLDPGELRALGLRLDEVLDFSANINPLGTSERVRQAASKANLWAYPDRYSLALREAIAGRLGIGIEQLLVGNGSSEIIHLLARAYLKPGRRCMVFTPTFGEYEAASSITGSEVLTLRAQEAQAFRWSVDEAVDVINKTRPSLIFLCNPNNPTGIYLERADVERISQATGSEGLLVVDTAYMSLADYQWDVLPLLSCGNVAILNSMTKDHALAGLRLGYLLAQQAVIEAVGRMQPPWSVNSVAQAAGLAALDEESHVVAGRQVISDAKAFLYRELAALDVETKPSEANFILARVGDASKARDTLLREGIAVRDCTSFGLPEYIRIAVRKSEECSLLVENLKRILGV